jgi:NRPS condensation-like uncharacterized protein
MTRGSHREQAGRRGALPKRRFGVVDELSCYFDTQAEPANIHLEFRVAGHADPAALREAITAALLANPHASSRRARHRPLSSRYTWEFAGRLDFDPVSFTTFATVADLAGQREAFLAMAPSVDRSPPARFLIASGAGCYHVILNANHATMDGLSWVEVLRDIGRRYAAATGGSPKDGRVEPPMPPASPSQAAPDPSPAITAGAGPPRRPRRPRRPARIADDGGGQRGCGLQLLLLPGVPGVPHGRDAVKPTVNDALITALIATIGRWNAERGRRLRPVRITTPVNTRAPGDRTSAGHLTRLVTISALPASAADLGPLLLDVAGQTRRARERAGPQLGLGNRGIAAVRAPTPVKRWLVRAALRVAGPLVCDTAMLTNIGNVPDPPDVGSGAPVTMALSGPAQMPRGLSLAVVTAAGQPMLGFRYNRALLSDAAAQQFVKEYMRTLEALTEVAGNADALSQDWSGPPRGVAAPGYERR